MSLPDFHLKHAEADLVLDLLKHACAQPGTSPGFCLTTLTRVLQSYVDRCDKKVAAEAALVAAQEAAGGMPV